MPYRTTREWIPLACHRCEARIEYHGRGRGPKWCDPCRPYAAAGNALRNALRALTELGGRDVDEARVTLEELRDRLNVGEDLFPLDGAMSVSEFAHGRSVSIPREEWPQLRALRGSAVR